ncbi:hypothetical protein NEISICOT_00687 [Neisseria sicca ATCC 29256]|uniref:Uncharacterized protein n=1 Tax=Neisseria sicca ATCC 29256 TaxID=547045 RepID=C6M2E8_NEISI|nr:hypothetical protein NEISICOT_00687 [Neisseria sicca ATCC 29256]
MFANLTQFNSELTSWYKSKGRLKFTTHHFRVSGNPKGPLGCSNFSGIPEIQSVGFSSQPVFA